MKWLFNIEKERVETCSGRGLAIRHADDCTELMRRTQIGEPIHPNAVMFRQFKDQDIVGVYKLSTEEWLRRN